MEQNAADNMIQALMRAPIQPTLSENLEAFKTLMNAALNKDLIIREFNCAGFDCALLYMEGMADTRSINDYVLEPCLREEAHPDWSEETRLDRLKNDVLAVGDAQVSEFYYLAVEDILNGKTALLCDGCAQALGLETRGYEKRPVGKTLSESVVLGPQEGFVENLRTNITLIRRIVRSPMLVSEMIKVGKALPTQISMLYLEGVADPKIVNEMRRRLKGLNVNLVPGSGYLQQLIEDQPFAFFPQILQTERPDRAASMLSDGQIVLLADGSPFALVAPITLFHLLHASDDTFMRWQYGSFLRIVRMLGLFISLLLPGLYIAFTQYHAHMIPMSLLTSIAETRANVPFPVIVEVLIMECSFYLINEAGTRIPSLIGPALGIVGALILGQAAVSASIISPILIIVVAITGLGNYATPNYSIGIGLEILRLGIIAAAAMMGLFGISLAMFLILCSVCSMKSLGQPFMAPIAPLRPHNPDLLLRLPLWMQKRSMFYARVPNWLSKTKGPMRLWRRKEK